MSTKVNSCGNQCPLLSVKQNCSILVRKLITEASVFLNIVFFVAQCWKYECVILGTAIQGQLHVLIHLMKNQQLLLFNDVSDQESVDFIFNE